MILVGQVACWSAFLLEHSCKWLNGYDYQPVDGFKKLYKRIINYIDQIKVTIFVVPKQVLLIMSQQIEQHYISSSAVESYIFIMPLHCVYEHISAFHPNRTDPPKFVRVCYLVLIDDFSVFIRTQDKLSSLKQYQHYNANLVPFESSDEIQQHIKMMEKMNESQFQDQYVEMLDLLEKEIQGSLIKDFCLKQLNWSQAKTNKFWQKQQTNTISKFLNYRGFNQLESIKINQIWNFIQAYLTG